MTTWQHRKLLKSKNEKTCFICGKTIKKGDLYLNSHGQRLFPLCEHCKNTWEIEGGMLGQISRSLTKEK